MNRKSPRAVPLDRAAFLGRAALFKDLRPAERREIQARFAEQRVERDQFIFQEGDAADFVYVLVEGKVKIVKQAPNGKEMILEVFAPPEVFGGATLLLDRHPASAVAMGPSLLLRLARSHYQALLRHVPAMALQIIERLAERLQQAHQAMRGLAVERAEARVARLLFKLADKVGVPAGGGTRLALQLTRQEIADMVGCTLETAIRILSRWQKEGLIKTEEGVITLFNRRALERRLAGS